MTGRFYLREEPRRLDIRTEVREPISATNTGSLDFRIRSSPRWGLARASDFHARLALWARFLRRSAVIPAAAPPLFDALLRDGASSRRSSVGCRTQIPNSVRC